MNKKTPERKCLGCGTRKQKNELIRVVRLKDGTVTLDKTGKISGRGAYLCPDILCYNKARKAKRFETNLEVSIPEEVYDALAQKFSESEEQ